MNRLSHIVHHLNINPTASRSTSNLIYVLITGSNRGLGYGLVEYLLQHRTNYFVIASCRNAQSATKLQSLIKQFPSRASMIELNTSSQKSIDESIQNVSNLTDRIDVLINNAAISSRNHPWETVLEINEKEMQQILQTNVIGPAMMFKAYYNLLKRADGTNNPSKVLNVSSQLASSTLILKKLTATTYRMSKAALNMLTLCQSQQIGVKDNIIVLSVHPGHVNTDMGTSYGTRKATVDVDDACKGVCELIECMKLEKHNGAFYDWNLHKLAW